MYTDLTQEFYIIQIQQPVCIVCDDRLVIVKIDESGKLFMETLCIVIDLFFCHHISHIGFAGRVTDHCGSAAKQGDRSVTCSLHVHHCHDRQEMSCGQAVCGCIKSNVKCYLFFAQKLSDLCFVRCLLNKSSFFQDVKYVLFHRLIPP